jgi:hypothetical protein
MCIEGAKMSNEGRSQTVRVILLKDWDPLGVGDNPHLADEYDDYIPAIIQMLDDRCTIQQLESYLLDIEARWELSPDSGADLAAKNIIKALRDGS